MGKSQNDGFSWVLICLIHPRGQRNIPEPVPI